jgi:hypothetical protein
MASKLFAGLTVVVALALVGAAAMGTFSNPTSSTPAPTGDAVQPTAKKATHSCPIQRMMSGEAPSCCGD